MSFLSKAWHNVTSGVKSAAEDIPGSVRGALNNPLQSVEKGVGGTFNLASLGTMHDTFGMDNKQTGGAALAIMALLGGGAYLSGGGAGTGAQTFALGPDASLATPVNIAEYGNLSPEMMLSSDIASTGGAGFGSIGYPGMAEGLNLPALGGTVGGTAGAASGFMGGGRNLLGTLGAVTSIGSGLYGMYQANQLKDMAKNADPFGPYRAGYAQQLAQLEAHPEMLQNLPGYEAGLQAVQRGMSTRGLYGSGNEAIGLLKYGGDIYNQQVNTLSQLAGANIGPGTSADIFKSGIDLAGESLGSLGYGATMLGGWNPNYQFMGRAA